MQPLSAPRVNWSEDEDGGGGGESEPEWVNRPFVPENEALMDRLQTEDEREPEEPEIFEPRPLKSRRLEADALGPTPETRDQCFGCVYFGDGDTVLVADTVIKLEQMARQSFGRTDLVTLARAMHEFYVKEIKTPELPEWPAAQVLDHLRHHNQDPLVQQLVLLAEVQELRTAALDHVFEQSKKNGRVRINKAGVDAYERFTKLQLHIQKQDASKMAFYSAAARVNPENYSQGALSWNTKKLHSTWKK